MYILTIDKFAFIITIINWAIKNEWLIASSDTDSVDGFTGYELCTEDNFEDHLEGKWIRLKKNGEAIQLRTR